MQETDGVREQAPGFDGVVLACGREVGRGRQGQHHTLADFVDEKRRAGRGVGAHGPLGAFLAFALARGAVGFEKFAGRSCGRGFVNGRRAFDEEGPVPRQVVRDHAFARMTFGKAHPIVD